jgi:transposase
MAMERRNFDRQFREGAVRIVRETGKPIAQVARELGVHEGTLGRWVNLDRRAREGEGPLSESERDELNRLRKENAELAMERDVLKRSAAHYAECRIMPSVVLNSLWGKGFPRTHAA